MDSNVIPMMKDGEWFQNCEICNIGLCKEVDEQRSLGVSEKKIFQHMANQTDGLYTPGAIRHRYKYYTASRGKPSAPQASKGSKNKRNQKPPPPKKQRGAKTAPPPRAEKEQPPLNPHPQKTLWEVVADELDRLVKYIGDNFQLPPDPTDKTMSRVDFNLSAIRAFYERTPKPRYQRSLPPPGHRDAPRHRGRNLASLDYRLPYDDELELRARIFEALAEAGFFL